MKTLDLTVLFSEGPIARAYLVILRRSGYKFRKIIRMVPPLGRFGKILPAAMRMRLSTEKQNLEAHDWPRKLSVMYPGLYGEMVTKISQAYALDEKFFEEIRQKVGLDSYGDIVERIELDGVKDPRLGDVLSAEAPSMILFTGGGILPKAIFEEEGIRLMHIHPGRLPDVRGADGLLWSMLLRGAPGVSCFIMNPNLDDGDLVKVEDKPPLTFDIPSGEDPSDQDLYRMLFSYYDPVLRAHMLSEVLAQFPVPSKITATAQDSDQGTTYHFMEPRLRGLALRKIMRRGS